MTRVALYARYSSDQQRAASIADQIRVCREFAGRQAWGIAGEFTDAAVSGASLLRPGIQALLHEATGGRFDVVLAESLDRLSRDQEDTAALFKRLSFAGVRIVTLSEGDIGHLHVGLKGTMNALYLHELAEKTRRGLRGRVESGRSGGGLCFGYRALPAAEGEPRGAREVDVEQAALVLRIFTDFAAGLSAKAIAKQLNAERVAGPMGSAWSPSTIHGNPKRGTGILNNELYVGRLVWNRLRYVKDPDTGRRISRLNPSSSWVVVDVPELRIIEDALWTAVKSRQATIRRTHSTRGYMKLREPKYLFSGLTKCAVCGGGFILSSHRALICFNARNRGTCTNLRSIKRVDVEQRVLRAMRERLLDPGRFASLCKRFTETVNRLRREQRATLAGAQRELVALDRQIAQIVDAVANGFRTEAMRQKLEALEERKMDLKRQLTAKPAPTLHPSMAQKFRDKVTALCGGLEDVTKRETARAALRGLIENIVIPAEPDGLLQVVGNLGAMLEVATGRKLTSLDPVAIAGCGGAQPAIATDILREIAEFAA